MTIRSSSSLSLLTLALTSVALGGCLSPGVQPTTDSDSMTETGSTSTTSETGMTSGSETETETTATTETTETMTTTSSGVCGDGNVDGGEECDDGVSNSDDAACTSECLNNVCGDGKLNNGVEECDDGNTVDGDGCTASCKSNVCGDGIIHEGFEICDDGVNDGSYGGCMDNCAQLGPYCGDTFLQEEEEECDDVDISTGCLSTCKRAKSCLEIITDTEGAPSGVYPLATEVEGDTLDVYCEMVADGGGYTFLKISQNVPKKAADADALCSEQGMQLFIPRSADHLAAAWTIATSDNLIPLGDGGTPTSGAYVTMLGIYPDVVGQSCPGAPFNSEACPEWTAGDGGTFFVSAEAYEDEPSADNCAGCSMEYAWDDQGVLFGYAVVKGVGNTGYRSTEFFCDVGDKMP